MANSLEDPNPSAAKGEKRHRWTYGRDDWLLPLVRKAVAARPEWRQWRAGRKETLAKCRSLFLRYAKGKRPRDEVSGKVELELLKAILTYLGTIVAEGEYCREDETRGEPAFGECSQINDEIGSLFEDADDRDLVDADEREALMATLLWMLVNGCTPNRVRGFMKHRSIRDCQLDLDNFERHYAAKVVADALDALDDVEDREA